MIKLSAMYPSVENDQFDLEYYLHTHLPMVQRLLGDACKRAVVDEGVAGIESGSKPPFAVVGHLYFDSVEDLQQSFAPHAAQIIGDIPNFTNVQPQLQISKVIM